MRVFRGSRGHSLTDVILMGMFLLLLVVYLTKLSNNHHLTAEQTVSRAEVDTTVHNDEAIDGNLQGFIDARVKTAKDFRSAECRREGEREVNSKVTVILHFHEYEFYDLKLTISALLYNTPSKMLEEIIIVDDGSTLGHIKTESTVLVDRLPKCRLIVNGKKEGLAKVRSLAMSNAISEIVVFADKNVQVEIGWLEPLIHVLTNHPESIVTPHLDHITEPVSYDLQATSDKLVTTFSWRLTLRVTETKRDQTRDGLYKTPVLRGDIFAVRKSYFVKIGGYDPEFEDAGGVNLELSLRAWLCGGPIYVTPCSRAGVLNLMDPIFTNSKKDVHRISELWFGEHKANIYRTNLMGDSASDVTRHKEASRFTQHSLPCKNIDWYLQNVADRLPTPSNASKHFGLLRSKSNRCGRLAEDGRLDLVNCRPDNYAVHPNSMMFEYTNQKNLKVSGACLTATSLGYLETDECHHGDASQQYDVTDSFRLLNMKTNLCVMHVTDPSGDDHRQIAMEQDCHSGISEFVTWQFLAV